MKSQLRWGLPSFSPAAVSGLLMRPPPPNGNHVADTRSSFSKSGTDTEGEGFVGLPRLRTALAANLTFLGTRGETKVRSHLHRQHSSLLVERVMIDCGIDWRTGVRSISPTAIVLTHAHPDHAGGLISGASCPVYATEVTWQRIGHYPIGDCRRIPINQPARIGDLCFMAYAVQHSLRAPAVGYLIKVGNVVIFYVPDVADIPQSADLLRDIDIFIGDGATVRRSMVRCRDGKLFGHAPITTQLLWCKAAFVRRAIFTHCGSPLVRSAATASNAIIQNLGREVHIEACIAYDGMKLRLDVARPAARFPP